MIEKIIFNAYSLTKALLFFYVASSFLLGVGKADPLPTLTKNDVYVNYTSNPVLSPDPPVTTPPQYKQEFGISVRNLPPLNPNIILTDFVVKYYNGTSSLLIQNWGARTGWDQSDKDANNNPLPTNQRYFLARSVNYGIPPGQMKEGFSVLARGDIAILQGATFDILSVSTSPISQ